MNTQEFRKAGHDLIEWIARYHETIGDRPVSPSVRPGEIASMLPSHAPEHGEPWDAITRDIDRVVMPGLMHWQSPRFFGYFPGACSYPAILGELLSAGLAVQGMLWSTSPACTEIENRVLDWLGRLIDLPEAFLYGAGGQSSLGGGVIQGTASEAALVALVAARERALHAAVRARGGSTDAHAPTLTAYASEHAHSSIQKSARVAGVTAERFRAVRTDALLRMDAQALGRAIAEDRARGLAPFFIAATVGTTSTGAVDDLRAIGALAKREGLWLHVDAAYAGAALVCPEFRWMSAGVEHADSFNFNPHKWLLTNFDCSCLWVRERAALIDALSITPEYLRNTASQSGGVVDYRDWQVPLGRRFRALKLWMVLRHFGADGLRAHIREHARLAQVFEELVRRDERFVVWDGAPAGEPRMPGLVCFRLREGDDASKALLARVNAGGRVFLSHTVVPWSGEPRYTLRFAVGSMHTNESAVREAWGEIGNGHWALGTRR